MRVACPVHPILDFIVIIIIGAEHKLPNPLLCSFPHPRVTSSLLGPHIPLSTLFSNTPILCVLPLMSETQRRGSL
jgi:hypothetical protein